MCRFVISPAATAIPPEKKNKLQRNMILSDFRVIIRQLPLQIRERVYELPAPAEHHSNEQRTTADSPEFNACNSTVKRRHRRRMRNVAQILIRSMSCLQKIDRHSVP